MKTKLKTFLIITVSLALLTRCSKNQVNEDKSLRPDIYTYVPDDKFEQLLINQGYDDIIDDYVLTKNIVNVTSLMFTSGHNSLGFKTWSSEISDFTGIEDFIHLEHFDCSNLNLTNLDLSKNVALKTLDCASNSLNSLEIGNLIVLEHLNCSYNNLSVLKLGSPLLTSLSCHENNLTELNINNAPRLTNLSCFNNKISSLDLNNNLNLKILQASGNLITTLDISKNTMLSYVECFENPSLECVQVNEDQLNNEWSFCKAELFSLNCN